MREAARIRSPSIRYRALTWGLETLWGGGGAATSYIAIFLAHPPTHTTAAATTTAAAAATHPAPPAHFPSRFFRVDGCRWPPPPPPSSTPSRRRRRIRPFRPDPKRRRPAPQAAPIVAVLDALPPRLCAALAARIGAMEAAAQRRANIIALLAAATAGGAGGAGVVEGGGGAGAGGRGEEEAAIDELMEEVTTERFALNYCKMFCVGLTRIN